jgi:hypothetical protein
MSCGPDHHTGMRLSEEYQKVHVANIQSPGCDIAIQHTTTAQTRYRSMQGGAGLTPLIRRTQLFDLPTGYRYLA